MHKRGHIPLSVKRRIWALPCAICGAVELVDVDHIVPVTRGGGSEETNLQPLCWQCNAKKGNRLTNDELRRWYEPRKELHHARHAYRLAMRYVNPYDGAPSFDVWLRQQNRPQQ